MVVCTWKESHLSPQEDDDDDPDQDVITIIITIIEHHRYLYRFPLREMDVPPASGNL